MGRAKDILIKSIHLGKLIPIITALIANTESELVKIPGNIVSTLCVLPHLILIIILYKGGSIFYLYFTDEQTVAQRG